MPGTLSNVELERAALIAMLRHIERTKWSTQAALRARFTAGEKPSEVLAEIDADLIIDHTDDRIAAGAVDLDGWAAAGHPVTTFLDDDYPARLRAVHDYPLVLFGTSPIPQEEKGFAIVGTRRPSPQGEAFASELARGLGEQGFSIVSGLARGIDTSALRSSVACGARTVAVIGSGLKHSYPAENRGLQNQIAEEGLVLTQFFPEAPPARKNFPIRNHTMSAYSAATVIVEAGETSGTRIQAKAAIHHGRPLIVTLQVATQTKWCQEYVGAGYDVTVVNNVETAIQAAIHIAGRADRYDNWLRELVAG